MKPLIPRPAVTLIALALTFGLLGNVFFDATTPDYDGLQTTLAFSALIGGILGLPIGADWIRARHNRSDDDAPTDELERKP